MEKENTYFVVSEQLLLSMEDLLRSQPQSELLMHKRGDGERMPPLLFIDGNGESADVAANCN